MGQPAGQDKISAPGYQGILDAQIPSVPLANDAGQLRVIAGNFEGFEGPRQHLQPDERLGRAPGRRQDRRTAAARRLDRACGGAAGTVMMVNGETRCARSMATLSVEGNNVVIEANGDAKLLLLAGEPLDEPVVGYGRS